MIRLEAGDAAALILPEQGAALARLDHAGRALVAPLPEGAEPGRGWFAAFLMAPWTNRLDAGRFTASGVEHRMPINRPEENTAIHGFLRDMPWTVREASADAAVLDCSFDRAPFKGSARMTLRLHPDHLAMSFALTNHGAAPVPMGFGWHPYFARHPGTRLRFVARTAFGRNARGLAVDPHASQGLDATLDWLEGLDGHFAGWDGTLHLDWPDGSGLLLQAEGAWAKNLHVFVPRGADAVALEPVSHAPNAANDDAAAGHGAMHVLQPGATLDGSLRIHWR
ncbi:aldose epimerase [Roseomonas sp. AR75]|uniref:aldose epimerase family protein n=1 Tax=Roseomonas sp. AR75 TaxID=2562311 RepID=UPI001485143B|nr:aldose epimerase [Roseomonas sp. AR75]